MARNLMIVAGEASGDMYGGRLVRALLELAPGTRLTGIGGDAMAQTGVELQAHIPKIPVYFLSMETIPLQGEEKIMRILQELVLKG